MSGTAGPVDGTVHPAPAQQAGIGGVHNRINPLLGDITDQHPNPTA